MWAAVELRTEVGSAGWVFEWGKSVWHLGSDRGGLGPNINYALAEIIKDWHGIRHLDLRDNDLDDGAATALLKACGDESAPHCVLDLEGNEGISDEIFRRVDMARGVEAFFRS